MATATQSAQDADVTAGAGEVSLPQKMLSAVSGSILTSLLGEYLFCLVAIVPAS
jgi:solute carrier family 25 protein 39/40